tara:strand:+ start:12368 stop:14962 length:2595 start_codon:yes stop_codon:yes gene_type:complete
LISILFLLLKVKTNPFGKIHKVLSYGILIFIGYLLVISGFKSVNIVESYWGILYLFGWLGVYGFFALYSNQTVFRHLIIVTSIIGGTISVLVPIDIASDFIKGKIFREGISRIGLNYHYHSDSFLNSKDVKAPDGSFSATKIIDRDKSQYPIRFGYRFQANAFGRGNWSWNNISDIIFTTPNLKVGKEYTFSTYIFIPKDLPSTDFWGGVGYTSIRGLQTVHNGDFGINSCLLNEKLYSQSDTEWQECVDNLSGKRGKEFNFYNQINADLSKTNQWQRISGSFIVGDPLKHGDYFSIRVLPSALGKYTDNIDHFFYVWGAQIESGDNLTGYNQSFSGNNILEGGERRSEGEIIPSEYISYILYNASNVFDIFHLNLPTVGGLTSTFGNRNIFGMYLCFVIPASLIAVFFQRKTWKKYFHISMFFIGFTALMIIRSRAAWLGIAISLATLLYLFRYFLLGYVKSIYKNKSALVLITILGIVFLVLSFLPVKNLYGKYDWHKETVFSTIATFKNIQLGGESDKELSGGRIESYNLSMQMVKENPIGGIGLNNWRLKYLKYLGSEVNDINYLKVRQRPHNDLLWTTAEVGIIGMIVIIIFFIIHSKMALRSLKKMRGNMSELQLINTFIIMSFIAIIVESMFDFPRQRVIPNLYVWSCLGFLATQFEKKEKSVLIHGSIVNIAFVLVFGVVSIFACRDYRSNIYSQDLRYLKDKKEYRFALLSGSKSLSYGRNVDNTGTPVTFYMGISEYMLGNVDKALILFGDALSISPHHLGALENYMILNAKKGRFDLAFEYMERLQEAYPNYFSPRLNMAKICINSGYIYKAVRILTTVKKELKDRDKKMYKLVISDTDRLLSMLEAEQNDES